MQAWAVILTMVGVLVIAGVIPPEQSRDIQLAVLQGGILIVGAVWLVIGVSGLGRVCQPI
jgi:hypothetical protein